MRKSVMAMAVVALVAAAIAAVLVLLLPAWNHRQAAAWSAAGGHALERVTLPSSYARIRADGNFVLCGGDPRIERCFLGPGDPQQQVATVKAALGAVATGRVDTSCFAVKAPTGSPQSCRLRVSVAGSRLLVMLFAHPRDRNKPIAQWTYDGAYVQIIVDAR